MEHKCPHCGADLPENAACCPHCAKDIHPRKKAKSATPLLKKLLVGLLILAAAAAVGGAIWYFNRPYEPQEFDALGEVYYESGEKTYQLLVAWPNDRCAPAPDIYQQGSPDEQYRWPSRWYVNDAATGADAWAEFEPLVEQVTVEVVQDENAAGPLTAGEPRHDEDYSPDAAMICSLDFTGNSGESQIVWTVQMKNGDVIRVRQNIHVTAIITHEYHWEDTPMDTVEDLQALLDQTAQEIAPSDLVYIYLPPVTYEGGITIRDRSLNLYGSADEGGNRTTFTGPVQVVAPDGEIAYLQDIDFVGRGSGTGLSGSAPFRATNCTFTGWDTGVYAYGTSWVNVIGCSFQSNGIGFHFDSTGDYANHSMYNDNRFFGNDVAVRLDNVPTDITLNFQGSIFRANAQSILNLCDQPLDLSQATFE